MQDPHVLDVGARPPRRLQSIVGSYTMMTTGFFSSNLSAIRRRGESYPQRAACGSSAGPQAAGASSGRSREVREVRKNRGVDLAKLLAEADEILDAES